MFVQARSSFVPFQERASRLVQDFEAAMGESPPVCTSDDKELS